jgi:hypothetical protein
MERLRWTDEMMDMRMAAMDEKFDRLFDELHSVRWDIADVRRDLVGFRDRVTLIMAGLVVGLLGVLGGAVLAVD